MVNWFGLGIKTYKCRIDKTITCYKKQTNQPTKMPCWIEFFSINLHFVFSHSFWLNGVLCKHAWHECACCCHIKNQWMNSSERCFYACSVGRCMLMQSIQVCALCIVHRASRICINILVLKQDTRYHKNEWNFFPSRIWLLLLLLLQCRWNYPARWKSIMIFLHHCYSRAFPFGFFFVRKEKCFPTKLDFTLDTQNRRHSFVVSIKMRWYKCLKTKRNQI